MSFVFYLSVREFELHTWRSAKNPTPPVPPKRRRGVFIFSVDLCENKSRTFAMRKWPRTIPYHLKCKLEQQQEYRSKPSLQDQWATVLEWLETHGVEAPAHPLPREPELGGPPGHT